MDEAKLALEMNKLVHDECKEVPHDIGLRLLEIVKRNMNELGQPPVSDKLAAFREWATDHYGEGWHDMVWQEWEKYNSGNYRIT